MPRTMRVERIDCGLRTAPPRGREDIFVDDVDRQDFLKTLAEACQKTGWQVHAYCLMRNHFHMVLETPNANLVEGMRWFLSAYTIRLNHRQKLFGHVFSGRYKALLVEGSGNGYLKTACDYGEEDEQELKPLRRGWCLGSEEVRQKMLGLMEGKLGENHSGELRRETAEQKGNRLIAEELARLGWQESDLASRRRADPDKLAIAVRLRNETTLSIKWIAARVRIGSSKGAKSVLHRWVHGQEQTRAVQAKAGRAGAQLEFESTV